jgi:hypothetical protein
MREIVLSIPSVEAQQNIEIDVRINGKKRTLNYRVEIVGWESAEPSTDEKVNVLRRVIREHDPDWELIQIGIPEKDTIPVMFRKKVPQTA